MLNCSLIEQNIELKFYIELVCIILKYEYKLGNIANKVTLFKIVYSNLHGLLDWYVHQ